MGHAASRDDYVSSRRRPDLGAPGGSPALACLGLTRLKIGSYQLQLSTREWEPLGADMAHNHPNISTMAVAGGLLAVGGGHMAELYDEGSGRWFTLPHAMFQWRGGAGLISMPAAALTAAA